eukprot:gene15452-17035_t
MALAGQPEIVRSHQKDQYFLESFKSRISTAFLGWLGARYWIKFHQEISLLGDLCYFCLTNGSGMSVQNQSTYETLFTQAIAVLEQLNLVLFYFEGHHYKISQRILGLKYVLIRKFLKDSSAISIYKILGVSMGLQLAITIPNFIFQLCKTIFKHADKLSMSSEKKLQGSPDVVDVTENCISTRQNNVNCSLCLEKVDYATSTICGHLFCWNCIMEWSATKNECPVCRDLLIPSRLIFLKHFCY